MCRKHIVLMDGRISASVLDKWLFPKTISTGRSGITSIWKVKVLLSSNVKGALIVPQHVSFAPSAVVNEILEECNGAIDALLYLSIISLA